MTYSLVPKATAAFEKIFGIAPEACAQAPGRVNLIGEHTDYNGGFVMPLAIDRFATIAFRRRSDRFVQIHALDLDEAATFDLDTLERGSGWAEYLKGCAWALEEAGHSLLGWEGVLTGNIPHGAGLSSSAGVELATMLVFHHIAGIEWDPKQSALLAQQAENQWVGMNCGIMDQMISATGEAGHAVKIDCRTLELERVPLPEGTAVVVLDTMTRRGLVDSAYNERRAQCEEASRFFGVQELRDVSVEQLEAQAPTLSKLARRRSRHVVTENARVEQAVAAAGNQDSQTLGLLMNASHESLRDDFEVSSEALDKMVECAQAASGCWGARMTGAGFGGCAVALVAQDQAEAFMNEVRESYAQQTGNVPELYLCQAVEGASLLLA